MSERGPESEVVVGLVETHGRRETEALLEGLEVIPRRAVDYRGTRVLEFDIDAALARKPSLLLLDELAHTNAPGSRHKKRWQDIEELLAAGIDVYTTLNVQHIESLVDVVSDITGVLIRESVPDSFLDRADEIEMVDLPPDDLLQRLREGKVYVPEQAEWARENFFRKGNLIALRELALRQTAQRVDAQMEFYRKTEGIAEPWAVRERILRVHRGSRERRALGARRPPPRGSPPGRLDRGPRRDTGAAPRIPIRPRLHRRDSRLRVRAGCRDAGPDRVEGPRRDSGLCARPQRLANHRRAIEETALARDREAEPGAGAFQAGGRRHLGHTGRGRARAARRASPGSRARGEVEPRMEGLPGHPPHRGSMHGHCGAHVPELRSFQPRDGLSGWGRRGRHRVRPRSRNRRLRTWSHCRSTFSSSLLDTRFTSTTLSTSSRSA